MIGPQTLSSTSALPFRQISLYSSKSMTSLNRALASAFILQILVMRDLYMIIFLGLILFVNVYFISNVHYNCLGV